MTTRWLPIASVVFPLLVGCGEKKPAQPPNLILVKTDNSIVVLDPTTHVQRPLFQIDSSLSPRYSFRLDDSTLRIIAIKTDFDRSDTESVHCVLLEVRTKSESVHRIAQAQIRLHRWDTVLLHAEYFGALGVQDSTKDFGVKIRSCRADDYTSQLPGFIPKFDEKFFTKETNLFEDLGKDTLQLTHSQDQYNPLCVNGYRFAAIHPDGDRVFATFSPSSSCFSPNMFSTRNILLRMIGESSKLVSISKSTGRQKTILKGQFGEGKFSQDGRYLLIPQHHHHGDGSQSRFVYLDLEEVKMVPIDSAINAFWAPSHLQNREKTSDNK